MSQQSPRRGRVRQIWLVVLLTALAVAVPVGFGPAVAANGGTLAGTIVNLYLEPMKGVTVTLEYSETGTNEDLIRVDGPILTDAQGNFSFSTSQDGWYQVRAEALSGEVSMARATVSGWLEVPPARSRMLFRILYKPDPPRPSVPGSIIGVPAVGQILTKVAPVFPADITCNSGKWFYFPADGPSEEIGSGASLTIPAALAGLEIVAFYHCSRTITYYDQGLPNKPKTLTGTFTFQTPRVTVAVPDSVAAGPTKPGSPSSTIAGSTTNPTQADNLPKLSKTPRPRIIGRAVVGHKLKVKLGKWDKGVTKRIRWHIGGKAVMNAKAKAFKLKRSYLAKRVKVRVTATKPGYAKVVVTSKAKRVRSG